MRFKLIPGMICTICFASIALADSLSAAELRGTWLTTTANTAIATPQNTAATMRRLQDIGINTVYVECWKNGYTEFPSPTMNAAIGVPMRINPSIKGQPALQRDLLAECVAEAHKNHLACVAWFEYGFMAAYRDTHNELRARHDWLSLNQQGGDVAKNGFVWLNPLHPDAQNLLIGIITDAIKAHDLDGIQLDDRLAWPSLEMGYDDYTKAAYAHEHNGQAPPPDVKDPEWCRWREQKVTEFSQRLIAAIRAVNPHIAISLSPGPYPWARDNYLCNWPAWSGWDQFVPQCYRLDYIGFEKIWHDQLAAIGNHKHDLIAGIRITGDGPNLSWLDLQKSIELTRSTGAGGHCLWFSHGVLDVYPDQLKAFYHGFIPSPLRPAKLEH